MHASMFTPTAIFVHGHGGTVGRWDGGTVGWDGSKRVSLYILLIFLRLSISIFPSLHRRRHRRHRRRRHINLVIL